MSTEKGLKYGFFFIAGVAVILGVVLLGKKKPDDDDENPNPEPTPMDPVIDPVQASVPQNLATILASKDPIVALKGRKIYAKVANAKGRKTPYVNDGMVNNLAFESLNGEYLGYPTRVGNDLNGAKDASGKVVYSGALTDQQTKIQLHQANGIYYVSLNTEKGMEVHKLFVQQ